MLWFVFTMVIPTTRLVYFTATFESCSLNQLNSNEPHETEDPALLLPPGSEHITALPPLLIKSLPSFFIRARVQLRVN